ncbi:MAG TPA: carbamoyltransferase N-terminal domain-containing protein, partial [Ginsengibacter sp.]|nr:carbamoyltransferase N-terminal domain-containing protein [Ginsengibacter sp.]
MKIIGINAWHADASAALIIDGEVIVAIEEERFTRVKHWAGFPTSAIEFCLKEGGLDYDSVDFFVIGRDPGAKFLQKLLYLAKHPAGSWNAVKSRIQNSRKVQNLSCVLAKQSG